MKCLPQKVDAACAEHKPDMIWVAHAETSTGACQPMDQLGEIARNHDCLLAADTVTSTIDAIGRASTWRRLTSDDSVHSPRHVDRRRAGASTRRTPAARRPCPAPPASRP